MDCKGKTFDGTHWPVRFSAASGTATIVYKWYQICSEVADLPEPCHFRHNPTIPPLMDLIAADQATRQDFFCGGNAVAGKLAHVAFVAMRVPTTLLAGVESGTYPAVMENWQSSSTFRDIQSPLCL